MKLNTPKNLKELHIFLENLNFPGVMYICNNWKKTQILCINLKAHSFMYIYIGILQRNSRLVLTKENEYYKIDKLKSILWVNFFKDSLLLVFGKVI